MEDGAEAATGGDGEAEEADDEEEEEEEEDGEEEVEGDVADAAVRCCSAFFCFALLLLGMAGR